MRVVLDIETDSLTPKLIHCIVCKDIDTGEVYSWVQKECYTQFPSFAKRPKLIIAHNGIDFDLPVLSNLLGVQFDPGRVVDTLVLSRLLNFKFEGGHSLENWGKRLGFPKHAQPDFSVYSPQMLEYCIQDVQLNHKVYEILSKGISPKNQEAVDLEHQIAWVCREMQDNGFGFNKDEADALYVEINKRVEEIDQGLQEAFPPKIKEVPLKTKIRREIIPFNPSSPKQIVERLEGFWSPKERTEVGQAKICEANLATLSDEAPEAAKSLVERLLLAGRLRALKQWMDAYNEQTKRIHGRTNSIGTWTHRASHNSPNTGNIATKKSIKYKGKELANLASSLGERLRGLWQAAPGKLLVGTDADQIQLRIFADYIDDAVFTNALVNGDKKLGTDLHSLHAKLLEVEARDDSKTWIYAYFLGCGDEKSGFILGGRDRKFGRQKKLEFQERYPGLAKLRKERIPQDAKRGYAEEPSK